jgi:D-beta-D-heptose 7-phosphate kinase/D-beta-D-heptose 1-phosphate adenosyltransferase
MITIDRKRINTIIHRFSDRRILVLGDIMMDKYIWGQVARISPEAPVPVVEVKQDSSCLGGAGNVCFNLQELGARPLLVGTVGNDPEGEWIKQTIKDGRGIIIDPKRPTTVKTRIIAHHQQVVRVDREKKTPISSKTEKAILEVIKNEKYEGIILSDYNKGTLTKFLVKEVLDFSQKKDLPVYVDPKVENFRLFSPVTLIAPNHYEVEKFVRHPCLTDEQVEKAGQHILNKISTKYLILKRGEHGMSVFEKGKISFHIPTQAKEVFDVTGAGDTVIAAAVVSLLSGATIQESALISNAAAGVVVGKIGTAGLSAEELIHAVKTRF